MRKHNSRVNKRIRKPHLCFLTAGDVYAVQKTISEVKQLSGLCNILISVVKHT